MTLGHNSLLVSAKKGLSLTVIPASGSGSVAVDGVTNLTELIESVELVSIRSVVIPAFRENSSVIMVCQFDNDPVFIF